MAVQEGFDGARIPCGVPFSVHDDRDEATAARDVVRPADDVAVEGADHHLVGDNADNPGALVPQAEGYGIGGVVQLLRGQPDTVLAFLGHVAIAAAV
ncbi:hypothetical protein AAHB33_15220 [Paenarthrobacter sp. S56]|uniref:hypothetical protein n=1 Tax=Paenarthrobacter sp. S56 TaxID=3138179 RepID=UPI0032194755